MLSDESYRTMVILTKMGCSAIDADLSRDLAMICTRLG